MTRGSLDRVPAHSSSLPTRGLPAQTPRTAPCHPCVPHRPPTVPLDTTDFSPLPSGARTSPQPSPRPLQDGAGGSFPLSPVPQMHGLRLTEGPSPKGHRVGSRSPWQPLRFLHQSCLAPCEFKHCVLRMRQPWAPSSHKRHCHFTQAALGGDTHRLHRPREHRLHLVPHLDPQAKPFNLSVWL